MPLSSFSNNRQSGHLTKQARRRAVNQTHQEKQKHSTIQTHHQIQAQPISWTKTPLQKIRKNQQHIKNNSLHSIKPNIPTKIRVPHNNKIQSQENQETIKRETFKHPYSWN